MFTNICRTKKLITFFTLVFFIISLNWDTITFGSEQQAVVTGSYVNIRSGPSTSYARIDLVYKDDKLTVLEKKKAWYKVKLSNGKIGWIAGWLVSINKTTVPTETKVDWKTYERLGTVIGSTVNIRNGPSTSYSILSKVTKGTQLGINEAKGDWYNITLANGSKGWIAGWLINVSKNPSFTSPSAPAPTPTPTPSPTPPSRGDTGDSNNPSSKQNASVTGTIVNVRTGAGTNYAKVTQVKQGDTYAVLDTKDGWYKIQLPGSKEGWIAGWLVQINQVTSTNPEPSPNITQIGVVTGTTVNIRKGPSTSYDQLAQVKKGDQLNILEEKDGWYKITTSNIKEGWIAGWLVEVKVDEKIIQISLSEKSGAPVLILAGNEKLTYTVNENTNSLEIVFQKKYKVEGLDNLKLIEPYKEIKVLDGEISKIYIGLNTNSHQVVLSQDKQVLNIICQGTALKGKKIILDPGHGGLDPGAVGPTGYREKEFNLNTALKLKDVLELAGAEVVLSRSSDVNVSLLTRSTQANTTQADIFISIHANASTSSSVKGTKTFYYAPSSSSKLYAQLTQRKKLAELVQLEMVKGLQRKDMGIAQENFSVLRETNMPSILVEVAFLSNPEEEKLLQLDEFQNNAAWSIANGIVQYFE